MTPEEIKNSNTLEAQLRARELMQADRGSIEQAQLKFMRTLALAGLRKLQEGEDIASGHVEADRILTTLLVSLGYEDVVEAYEKIRKWYE